MRGVVPPMLCEEILIACEKGMTVVKGGLR
jgi:hypothetical protein